jgi:hypothetical protein
MSITSKPSGASSRQIDLTSGIVLTQVHVHSLSALGWAPSAGIIIGFMFDVITQG